MRIDFLIQMSDIIFVLAVISTVLWMLGPILKILEPTNSIQVHWGRLLTYYGYHFLTFQQDLQYKYYFGMKLWRNNSIYPEGPLSSLVFCFGYIIFSFIKKDQSRLKNLIYMIVIFTTLSSTGIIVESIVFIINKTYQLRQIETKTKLNILIIRFAVPMIMLMFVVYITNSVLSYKSITDLMNYNTHFRGLVDGFHAFMKNPISGYGFNISEDFGNSTSGIFRILTQGGIVLCALYFIPFLYAFSYGIKCKDIGLIWFFGSTFVLLILVVWHYTQLYMFVLAVEYSFILRKPVNSITVEY